MPTETLTIDAVLNDILEFTFVGYRKLGQKDHQHRQDHPQNGSCTNGAFQFGSGWLWIG